MNEHPRPLPACSNYADRLIDFSDGELPVNARESVAAHVATCEACRRELGRLNRCLSALRSGIVATQAIHLPHERPLARRGVWIGIGGIAAAIVLAIGIASLPRDPPREKVEVQDNTPIAELRPPHSAQVVSPIDPLRQIALLEQQARLETSLALMPNDPWFADQRAANEELLSTFRKATLAAGTTDHFPHQAPGTKDTL